MSPTRILILGIGFVAAIVAAVLAVNLTSSEPNTVRKVVRTPTIKTTKILVTKKRLKRGDAVREKDLAWADWPSASVTDRHITKAKKPKALSEYAGTRVRIGMEKGDPAHGSKFIGKGQGFLASVLTKGMRAVSTKVSPGTAAGGFILPDDRVDLMMTRTIGEGEDEEYKTEPVLTNIRVLAIDQIVQEKDGQSVVVGKTATLELNDEQVRILTIAQQVADRMTLALRSLSDASEEPKSPAVYLIGRDEDGKDLKKNTVSVVRYGNRKEVKAKQ